jgi:uncharacterized membrane protein (UPF0127 family)
VPLPPQNKELPVYSPPSAVRYVLEVPAGWSARNNIEIGSKVAI